MMRISNVGVSIMADHAKQVSLTNSIIFKPQTCVVAAATDATQLLELHLCGCGFVTDFDVADICKVCAALQAQRVTLSTAGLRHTSHLTPHTSHLTPHISTAGL